MILERFLLTDRVAIVTGAGRGNPDLGLPDL